MNIQPYQTPPRMWNARLSPWLVNLCALFYRRMLKQLQRIDQIEILGLEYLTNTLKKGYGVLITPNHSSHTDPPILCEIASRAKTYFYFMTAWQVFARSNRLVQKLMQGHGCFSVDREGTDMRAFRQAVDILQQRLYPLVIFGEGEVYHINDRVTPFRDGPATIAITAQKHARRPILCIPCAIKFVYTVDPTQELLMLMNRLEQRILWRARPDLPLHERIQRFAVGILGVKEVEYFGQTQSGNLPDRIKGLAHFVLEQIEQRHNLKKDSAGDLPARVRICRREVIKELEQPDDSKKRQAAIDLDDLFMVIQLFSYPGDYVSTKPTPERIAETLDKFEEDILHVPTAAIRGRRKATVSFGEPIPAAVGTEKKTSVSELTEKLERGVQCLLDEINREP